MCSVKRVVWHGEIPAILCRSHKVSPEILGHYGTACDACLESSESNLATGQLKAINLWHIEFA